MRKKSTIKILSTLLIIILLVASPVLAQAITNSTNGVLLSNDENGGTNP